MNQLIAAVISWQTTKSQNMQLLLKIIIAITKSQIARENNIEI